MAHKLIRNTQSSIRPGVMATGGRLLLLILALGCSTLPLGASPEAAKSQPAANAVQNTPGPVPDVLVLVFAAPAGDGISLSYNSVVSDAAIQADLKALMDASGWQPRDINVSRKGSPENSTYVGFFVSGVVNWSDGTLFVEPFVRTFKRFSLIQVNYVLQGAFPFRSLRNYSDKYVDISWTPGTGNTAHNYMIRIKDHNFDRLNLPLVVEPPRESVKKDAQKQEKGGTGGIWLALFVALVAGALVFAIINRVTQKRKE